MGTDPDNERFDWGPYSQSGDSEGWAEDTESDDGKSGIAELLDRAEQQTTIKDAEANIDDYRPLAGRTFEATDVEREYVGDGSAWVQRATRGPNPTLESATVNGPTDTKELSVTHNGSPAITENVVAVLEDANDTTALALDTGSLPTYDRLRIEGYIGGHGGGAYNPVEIRVNNTSSSYYTFTHISGATLGQTSSATEFRDFMFDQWVMQAHWILNQSAEGQSTARGVTLSSNSAAHRNSQRLLYGEMYENGAVPVDSVQISTDFNATAKLAVVGVEY
jgi:hypothetical protein